MTRLTPGWIWFACAVGIVAIALIAGIGQVTA